jgi:hypothetical protein
MAEEFHSSEQGVAAATGVPTIATSTRHCRFLATIAARYSSIVASGKNRESVITAPSCDGRQPGCRASGRNPFQIGLRAGQGRRHRPVERQRVPGINAFPVHAALGQISTAGVAELSGRRHLVRGAGHATASREVSPCCRSGAPPLRLYGTTGPDGNAPPSARARRAKGWPGHRTSRAP